MSRYPVPRAPVRTLYEMSNSRFFTSIARADTVEEAREFIKRIRAEMPDASHHVYAFRVGYGGSVTDGMSDDGEPSGTSGPPTLAVLRGADVGDIVMVTTRYFGGTKLGTGGLVYAYTNAAKTALAMLEVEEKVSRKLLGVTVSYSLYERLKLLIAGYDAIPQEEEFAGDVTCYLLLAEEQISQFSAAVTELSSGGAVVVVLE